MTAARSTLADGWTTTTNANSANAASATAARGPDQPGGQQHRAAHDGDVGARHRRQVGQPRRPELRGGLRGQSRRVPQHQRGQHRRLIGAAAPRAPHRRTRCVFACAARWIGAASPRVGSPSPTAPRRSGRAASAGRCGRGSRPAGPRSARAKPAADAKTTTRPVISLSVEPPQRSAEHHPACRPARAGSQSA